MRISSLCLVSLMAIASAASAQDQSVDFGGISTTLPHWKKTKATGMSDVSVSRSGGIWLAGSNGTIWFSRSGDDFLQESGVSGFGRIATGDDNQDVGAVGANNHTLWFLSKGGPWFQSPASGVADVALGGEVWIAGTNGTIWYATRPIAFKFQIESLQFKQIKAEGFCRVATLTRVLWAVGCNGTLWKYQRNFKTDSAWDAGEWTRTAASGIADVAADELDTLWLVGKNGSVWRSTRGKDFVLISPPGTGFVSIGAGKGAVYAVHADGTVWRYKK